MVHKLKKYARRCSVFLIALSLVVSSFVIPASADDYEGNFIELLDYTTCNDSGRNRVDLTQTSSVSFPMPQMISGVCYVDMLVLISGTAPSKIFAGNEAGYLFELNVSKVSGLIYRVYGSFSSISIKDLVVKFEYVSSSVSSVVTFYSVRASTFTFTSLDIGYSGSLYSMGITDDFDVAGGYVSLNLTEESYGEALNTSFSSYIFPKEWYDYDYIDINLSFTGYSVSSVSAILAGASINVPLDVSIIGPTQPGVGQFDICIRVDLTQIRRTSSDFVRIDINGTYNCDQESPFIIHSVMGLVQINEVPELLSFWFRIKSFFTDLFGSDDNSADNALITQEEINVSVNNQLVGAVEDWNTHIEVVETGYDLAFTKTTPALDWIASLANGIYSGLGWFGRLYLLIGLVSVFMLVLSKSGLSRKIGSSIRRSG